MTQRTALIAITAAFAAVHLAMAGLVPFVDDEAYYALWATVPSWGYYDHPPMVAWWTAAGGAISDAPVFIRLPFVAAFAVTTLLVARTARLATGDARGGVLAALLFNLTVNVAVLGFVATPDAPSVLFWAGTVWALMERRQAGPGWWLAVGLMVGLGLQAKFTNLFLLPGLLVFLLATRAGRADLLRWQVWGGAVLALVIVAPQIAWNAAHDWIGLERQFGRIGADGGGWNTFLELFASTALLATPLTAIFAVRGAAQPHPGRDVLVALHLPILAYVAVHAAGSHVPGNWLFPVYPAIAVLAAVALAPRPRWIRATVATAAALSLAVLALAFWPGGSPLPRNVPPSQAKGWPATVAAIEAEMAATGATWLATRHYGLTGQLAHYFGASRVWALGAEKRFGFRGPLPGALCDAPGLMVVPGTAKGDALTGLDISGATSEVTRMDGQRLLVRYSLVPFSGVDCGQN